MTDCAITIANDVQLRDASNKGDLKDRNRWVVKQKAAMR